MNLILILCLVISIVLGKDASTDARIQSTYTTLMRDFQQDLSATALQSAKADFNHQYKVSTPASQLQSYETIYNQYKAQSDAIFETFKPIAHQIIENAAYNKNYNYYIWNEKTQSWHLYGRQAPNPPVDGSVENSKLLGSELKAAWVQLVNSSSRSNRGSAGLSTSIKMARF